MADPQHTPQMSTMDNFTVVLYRMGIVLMASMTVLYILSYFLSINFPGNYYLPLFAAGAAISSANVHLYDPRFRYLIPLMSWIGFVILGFTLTVDLVELKTMHLLLSASLGFFYAGAGMFAIKEQFCFKIPGLQTVPFFLAASVFAKYFGWELFEIITLVPAAVLLSVLAIAKWRMPLHFDVGDKSKYAI